MKSIILITALALATLAGCKNIKEKSEHAYYDGTDRHYKVELYSAGKLIFTDTLTGIIHPIHETAGFYYFKNDTLKELLGDYVITSTNSK